ncbi:MAG: hypothetical protein AAGC64_14150, partial [Bacteroidota bacterium]
PTNTGVEVVVTPSGNSSSTSTAINYNSLLFSSNPIHRAIGRARKDHNRNFMRHVVHNKTIHYSHWDYLSEISRTDNSGRLWQKIAAAGIGGAMLATAGSPLLIEALGSNITQFGVNAGIDVSTQTVTNLALGNDLSNVDIGDAALSGITGSGFVKVLALESIKATVDVNISSQGIGFESLFTGEKSFSNVLIDGGAAGFGKFGTT